MVKIITKRYRLQEEKTKRNIVEQHIEAPSPIKTNVGNAHILMSVLGAVIVAAGTGLVLTIYGAASQFLNTFGAIIASYSLPVLITIPVLIPIIKKYEKGLKEEVK